MTKKQSIFLFFFIFAGAVFPFCFVDGLAATIAAYTASALTGIFIFTGATISLVFSTFADWFLRITLSTDFISVPYTTGNAFVSYGWSIVRDFVNMFFILILIIIGLSTSLQIETYKWQKTLPRLVGVALLINFTPVVLGVFIDAANIMMNYFVTSLAEESLFVMHMRGLYESMASSLANAPWTSFTGGIITPLAMAIIFSLFNLLTGFVYALYGILFALRYVAIWLLVIISPFGFFCYILPATQGFFRLWWRWFVGWCIAGISGAFFLYLGEIMFQEGFLSRSAMMPETTEHQGMEIGAFIQAFPLLIPLFFILFGFFVTLALSSSGSKGIVAGFQKASSMAKKTTSQLRGETIGEKTQAAGAAVRNAFSPSSSPQMNISRSSGRSSSKKESSTPEAQSGTLHRRERTMERGDKRSTLREMRRPITETASYAADGTEGAIRNIATDISYTTETSKSTDEKPLEEKKCKECGATISGNASFCPLCRKNALPSISKEEK